MVFFFAPPSHEAVHSRVGCSQKSVTEILRKQRLTGNVKDVKISGRKRKTTRR